MVPKFHRIQCLKEEKYKHNFPKQNIVDIPVGFPSGSDGKESACNAGDPGSTPRLGRSPGEGNGYPLQYSGLESSMDREAWEVTVLGATKSLDMTE